MDFFQVTDNLVKLIRDRKTKKPAGSYTTSLFRQGSSQVAKKVGEEAIEVVIAAQKSGKKQLTYELADLWYHLLVLLVIKNINLDSIARELRSRYK